MRVEEGRKRCKEETEEMRKEEREQVETKSWLRSRKGQEKE